MDETTTGTHVESFVAFYDREFVAIALIAGTTVGDRVRGEDIAQEAFTRANARWQELASYDRPGAWVRRVAINLALDGRRRDRNEARAVERLGHEPVRETRAGDPAVWAAVDALPPRQRAVTVLHYFEDRSVAEIADLLDISESGTTSHLHKARASLARLLTAPMTGADND